MSNSFPMCVLQEKVYHKNKDYARQERKGEKGEKKHENARIPRLFLKKSIQ